MGRAGRAAAEARFSLQAMVEAYQRVYADGLVAADLAVPATCDPDAVSIASRRPPQRS
jgi:hypothetical protein